MQTSLLMLFALSACVLLLAAEAKESDLNKDVTLYASFDEEVKADKGGGGLEFATRSNHPTEKGAFVVTKGFSDKAFRIAKGKGISGGALDCFDVLPNNGRIFLPAKGNIGYKKGGWSGSVAMWVKTDPNTLLKTKFCDPVQITHKGANDGGLWFDFNDDKPRSMRMGAFPAIPPGTKGIAESHPKAPMVWVRKVGFKADDWHHVALTWANLDTGKADAVATLYVDGKLIGTVKDRAIAMDWDIDKAGIYVAINFIGLIDEFAVFGKALSTDEVKSLHAKPAMLSALKKK